MAVAIILIYFTIVLAIFYTYSHKFLKFFNSLKFIKFKYVKEEKSYDTWHIPGPLSLPFVGTKWIYFWKYKINKLHEVYDEMNKTYGDVVLETTSNGIPILNLFNRSDIEKVLHYPSKYPFRPPTEIVACYRKSRPDRYASIGLINAQGEEWHQLRTKLTPNVQNRKILSAFIPALNEMCDDFIECIRKRRDGNNVVRNFQDLANLMGLESSCCLVLGRRLGYLDDNSESNFKDLAKAVKSLFALQRDSYYGNGMWKYLPTKTYRDFVDNEEVVYRTISDIVDKTLADKQIEVQDNDVRSVFLSILNTEGLDIREKKSGIIDFITAGIELLCHSLSFILYYLSLNPAVQEKMFNEINELNSVLTQEDIAKAVYTKACIQEAFRISPAAFCIARILEEDFNLSGYSVPAGTVVLCQTMLASRKEANFKNANTFVPERWLDSSTADLGSSIVLPFGSGKRICPGKKFSELELTIIVIKLIKEFNIKYVSELDTQFEFLLAPKTPVDIQFCDRL